MSLRSILKGIGCVRSSFNFIRVIWVIPIQVRQVYRFSSFSAVSLAVYLARFYIVFPPVRRKLRCTGLIGQKMGAPKDAPKKTWKSLQDFDRFGTVASSSFIRKTACVRLRLRRRAFQWEADSPTFEDEFPPFLREFIFADCCPLVNSSDAVLDNWKNSLLLQKRLYHTQSRNAPFIRNNRTD